MLIITIIKKIFVLTSNQNKKKIKMVSFGQREVILIKYRSNFTYDKKELSLLPYKN